MADDPGSGGGPSKSMADIAEPAVGATSKPASGSRAARQRGRSEKPLSLLAHARSNPKFSFGKSSRFPEPRKALQRSRSEPGVGSGATSTTASDAGGIESARRKEAEFVSQEPSKVLSSAEATLLESPQFSMEVGWSGEAAEVSRDFGGASGSTSAAGGRSASASAAATRMKGPRIDGSFERLLDVRERAAHPRGKFYEPATTLGTGTALAYNHAPQFSFAGGPSRMSEFSGKKEHLAHLAAKVSPAKAAKAALAQTLPGGIRSSVLEGNAGMSTKKSAKRALNRGFGTEPRLRLRGGAYELPISPGPGAPYEVMRFGDPMPQWVASSVLPWGHRTSDRPTMRNPTASNVGPGEHTAHHGFEAASPAPIFGHPIKDLKKPEWAGSDPTRYDPNQDIRFSGAPSYSVGTGHRPDPAGLLKKASPGPAQYSPEDKPTKWESPSLSFGKAQRMHQCDLVDPDEPPGPGSHKVQKDPRPEDKPSAGLPKDMKLRYVPGLGPNTPGPGTYSMPEPVQHGRTINVPRPIPIPDIPGPSDYAVEDADHQRFSAAPAYAPLAGRKSIRKPPWREPEKIPEVTWKDGEKLENPVDQISFKPGGPSWSLSQRTKVRKKVSDTSETMVILSSMG